MALAMLFGYISMGLLLAAFLRSQFKYLQRLFFPSCILAGFILLLLGPSLLSIINIPAAGAEGLVYILLAALFAALGLRGFALKMAGRETAAITALLTKGLAFQGVIGLLFTLLLIVLVSADFFAGFGSLLMFGFGYDTLLARIFGGYWEKSLGFAGGGAIGYSFGILGLLFSYLLGLFMVARAVKKSGAPLFAEGDDPSFLSGFAPRGEAKPSPDRMTTKQQSIETLSFHFALIGLALLITFAVIRLVGLILIRLFGSSVADLVEILMNLQFLLAFAAGAVMRKLALRCKVDHVIDEGTIGRIIALLVDFMVVAAIISIPLVISRVHLWEILTLALIGAALTFLLVPLSTRLMFSEESLARQVALFAFLTGNISSSVALLRIMDPRLENPLIGHLALAGGLVMVTGLPLWCLVNLPLVADNPLYIVVAAVLMILYGGLWYLAWHFLINRKVETEASGEDVKS